MEIYHFSQESPVSHVEFTQDAKRVWTARIFPQAGAPCELLSNLTSTLNARRDGIIAVPHSEKGVHTLFASGFQDPERLLIHMKEQQFAKGKVRRETVSKEAENFTAGIRDASLKLAGIFYLISDASLAVSGMMSGRYKETIAGALYSSGGVVLAQYGRKDAHAHLKELSLKLGDYFAREGIEIPKDSPIQGANRERQGALVEGLERFAYSYPSQIFNTIVAVCGVQLMQSGINHKKAWDTTSGALVLGGALAGLMIPEKKEKAHLLSPLEEQHKTHTSPLGKIYDWAQEKPLRIPGMLWFGNNIALTVSALKERQKDPKQYSYMFKLGYAASAVIANSLMFISSKQHSKRFDIDSDAMQALMSVAANVIIQQPPAVQDHMIQQVSGYMASQGDTHHSANEIAASIRAEIKELTKNPFQKHSKDMPAECDAPPAPQDTQHAAKLRPAKTVTDWKTSVTDNTQSVAPSIT